MTQVVTGPWISPVHLRKWLAYPRDRKPILLPFLVTANTASAGKYGSLQLPASQATGHYVSQFGYVHLSLHCHGSPSSC